MKTHPYFRWFPADAETDAAYSQLSLEALGLYHRMLNVAWMNKGLPHTPNAIAAVLRVPRKTFLRLWVDLQPFWELRGERLHNRRQEEERGYAQNISERARRGGEGKAASRDLAEPKQEFSRNLEVPRAYDSDSVSVSGKLEPGKIRVTDLSGATSQRFDEWWSVWSKIRGSYNKLAACQAYLSVVTTEREEACFECTRSYLASLKDPSNGFNPDNFLFKQSQEDFASRWIPRKKSQAEVFAEIEREAEEADRRNGNAAH